MRERIWKHVERAGSPHGPILALISALTAEIFLAQLGGGGHLSSAIGRVAILFVSFLVIYRFAVSNLQGFVPVRRDMVALLLSVVISVALIWVGRLFAYSIPAYSRSIGTIPDLASVGFYYAIPFAAGALVLQAILGHHYALLYGIFISLIAAVYLPGDFVLVPFVFTSCLVACVSLSQSRSRSAYLRAGMNIGLFSIPFALGSLFLEPNPQMIEIVVRPLFGMLGGVVCAFIASGFTPLAEYLGGYVTDLRLIEMATLDHPVLKDLSVRAPGTWNHSMVMGMMAEVAANAINANPVIARVGAYFHDIGKIAKPLYFIENQFGEENRHDKLSPSMSALIIRSHVKEGIELARKHRLPRVIIEMIPQHHGTSLIEYFYEKAQREVEGGDTAEVDENLYRYPGPKPQTKEAGILMLADGIEAAARTLTDPTVDRIQVLVQKMVNKVFASGQLDECQLTLKDLHLIANSFVHVLHSIHHQRVVYDEGESDDSSHPTEQEGEGDLPDGAEKRDLKRLGCDASSRGN